ncbi:carboxypeptidase-like regulatory domain-containing protein [Cellulophaga sp. HaHa_2_1]|uniref:carboxypeptidase-like regulatory domain-containing protein n=1 Tax=Cellulophaga sp. HaHa_2_1 TaxID=2749994 RepID=UPI001C77EA18|nr:carboxypeptidase-like regulatory domain-containing protein [Cellulophaga sp. HaHa_2_1]QXP54092.1 carboxypeptidase-like regulatory domain-containing protein [Cellulophaga sp. HaHa_2_1]
MKNSISVSVKKPCSEKFSTFSTTDKGGFCGSCEKEVIDFTTMSKSEILNYLCTATNSTCGRFKTSQLNDLQMTNSNVSPFNFLTKSIGAMSFSLLSLCAISSVNAQDEALSTSVQTALVSNPEAITNTTQSNKYKVKGLVVDQENLPLPGVSVVLKGTNEGVSTDFDGNFEFSRRLSEGDVLVFSYVGYDTQSYTIVKSETDTIEISILFDSADIELMGDISIEGVYQPKRNIAQKIGSIFN